MSLSTECRCHTTPRPRVRGTRRCTALRGAGGVGRGGAVWGGAERESGGGAGRQDQGRRTLQSARPARRCRWCSSGAWTRRYGSRGRAGPGRAHPTPPCLAWLSQRGQHIIARTLLGYKHAPTAPRGRRQRRDAGPRGGHYKARGAPPVGAARPILRPPSARGSDASRGSARHGAASTPRVIMVHAKPRHCCSAAIHRADDAAAK